VVTPEEGLLLPGDVEPVADLLRSLSNPQRLMIVCALVEGELGVTDLERGLSIRQPSLSQHLGSLREAGIISGRKEGKAVFYRLSNDRAAMLVEALHAIFCEPRKRGRQSARDFFAAARASASQTGKTPTRLANPLRAAATQAAVFARVGEREQP
jgi:DNA-binding transcriptional ArsR family regulator